MNTRIICVDGLPDAMQALEEAAAALRNGGLVVFPTETVYGIGADALNPEAVSGIFRAKGRPQDNPLIVHTATPQEVLPLVSEWPETAEKLAGAFWPGPLTLILPKSDRVPSQTSAGLDTVAVRIPSHPVARALIRLARVPVAAPSANLSGSPSPTDAAHCVADLSGRVDWIIDGGPCEWGIESTVVSLAGSRPLLLRPGAVTPAELEAVVGAVDVDPGVTSRIEDSRPVPSPGMKYRHYAPRARVILVHADDEAFYAFSRKAGGDGVWFMGFDSDVGTFSGHFLSYGEKKDSRSQSKQLFRTLRKLDELRAETVYARAPETTGPGLAVYNRLLRAAGFHEIYL